MSACNCVSCFTCAIIVLTLVLINAQDRVIALASHYNSEQLIDKRANHGNRGSAPWRSSLFVWTVANHTLASALRSAPLSSSLQLPAKLENTCHALYSGLRGLRGGSVCSPGASVKPSGLCPWRKDMTRTGIPQITGSHDDELLVAVTCLDTTQEDGQLFLGINFHEVHLNIQAICVVDAPVCSGRKSQTYTGCCC